MRGNGDHIASRSCSTKVRYDTVQAARESARHLSYGRELSAYGPCQYCEGGFHLGGPRTDAARRHRRRRAR